MKTTFLIATLIIGIALFGCARVDVGGTDKPIKLDVTMRVDIYQHVVKQADDIESLVRGQEETPQETEEPQSFLRFFVDNVWAQGLSPEIQQAAKNRKARLTKVNELLSSAAIGENNQGLLEIRKKNAEAEDLISAENADREIIYKNLAEQNGVSVDSIKEIYAEKMQGYAPGGSPIQGKDGNWTKK